MGKISRFTPIRMDDIPKPCKGCGYLKSHPDGVYIACEKGVIDVNSCKHNTMFVRLLRRFGLKKE